MDNETIFDTYYSLPKLTILREEAFVRGDDQLRRYVGECIFRLVDKSIDIIQH